MSRPLLKAHPFVEDEMLLVVHPAIRAVLFAEAIFGDVLAGLEQYVHLGFDARQIFGCTRSRQKFGFSRYSEAA